MVLSLPNAALAQGVIDKTKTRPGNDSDVKLGSLNTGTVSEREGGPDGETIEWIEWLLERRADRETVLARAGPAVREMFEREPAARGGD